MKKIITFVASLLITTSVYAALTVGNIPSVKTSGTSPAMQNSVLSTDGTNVGIGSVNPTQKLDVNGIIKATTFSGGANGLTSIPATQLVGSVSASQISGVIPIENLATGTPDGTRFIRDDGTLQVPPGSGGGSSQWTTAINPLNIYFTGGNVGIGSTTPVASLDTGTGKIISLSVGADKIYNVNKYGALGDGIYLNDAAITSGTPNFTSATAVFTASDVGKVITIIGAGAAGVDLTTTISAYVSATAVTLSANASTTVTGKDFTYGTDDTVAIQAAINAVGTNKGGTVFFPAGIYIVNGTFNNAAAENSQLYLPVVGYQAEPQHIKFLGAFPTELSLGYILPRKGSIIFATRQGTAGQSVINAYNSASTGPYVAHSTNVIAQFENLTFRTITNPVHTFLDLTRVMQSSVDFVNFETVTSYLSMLIPTTTTSYAIKAPGAANHAFNHFNHMQIYGFYNGIAPDEHTTIDNSGIYFCVNAINANMGGGHAFYVKYLTAEDDVNVVTISGSGTTRFFIDYLDIEHASSGWYQTNYDINDSGNKGIGQYRYYVSIGTFTKNGGTGIIYYDTSSYTGVNTLFGIDLNMGGSTHLIFQRYPADTTYNMVSLNGLTTSGFMGLLGGKSGDLTMYENVNTGGSINFGINGVYNKFLMNSSGNIGINTATPGTTLDVQGTIRAPSSGWNIGIGTASPSRVCITNTTWSTCP